MTAMQAPNQINFDIASFGVKLLSLSCLEWWNGNACGVKAQHRSTAAQHSSNYGSNALQTAPPPATSQRASEKL